MTPKTKTIFAKYVTDIFTIKMELSVIGYAAQNAEDGYMKFVLHHNDFVKLV